MNMDIIFRANPMTEETFQSSQVRELHVFRSQLKERTCEDPEEHKITQDMLQHFVFFARVRSI